jgi:hypothetical protein
MRNQRAEQNKLLCIKRPHQQRPHKESLSQNSQPRRNYSSIRYYPSKDLPESLHKNSASKKTRMTKQSQSPSKKAQIMRETMKTNTPKKPISKQAANQIPKEVPDDESTEEEISDNDNAPRPDEQITREENTGQVPEAETATSFSAESSALSSAIVLEELNELEKDTKV